MTENKLPVKKGDALPSTAELIESLPADQRNDLTKFHIQGQMELNLEAARMQQKQMAGLNEIRAHVDAFNELDRQANGLRSGHTIRSTIDMGSGHMEITSRSGGASSCFVATATYQDTHHPDVEYLRRFRDAYLSKSRPGLLFIHWYYRKAGPVMSAFIKGREWLRVPCLYALKGTVSLLKKMFPA